MKNIKIERFIRELGKRIKHILRVLGRIDLHKIRHILIIVLVIIIIFMIPIIFGSLSNSKYKEINIKDTGKESITKVDKPGKIIDIDTNSIKVLRTNGEVEKINLEEYVTGVVGSELPLSFEKEAMIAQGILARTFAVSKMLTPCSKAKAKGGDICDTVHCQVYSPIENRIESMGKDANKFKDKVNNSVKSTKGEVLSYDGFLVRYPQYFSMSSGKTENIEDVFSVEVPYLRSVSSEWDKKLEKYEMKTSYSYDKFVDTINSNYKGANITKKNLNKQIEILSKTEGGSIKEIRLGKVTIKGTEFRTLFGIRSANFDIKLGDEVVITTKGYGHGVGMSQWGANSMAKEGSNHKEILAHYYTDVAISDIKKVKIEIE
ncbi:MAG: stage II sporulation protein D [Sarcina sp.]